MAYALERWLYRVSVSPYRNQFILKGGLLLAAFDARRPTRDADLLGRMDNDVETLVDRVSEIAGIDVDDGLEFDADQIRAAVIREDDLYSGLRITMPATLGKARIKLALDANFGDPVTPGAVLIRYPSVLESQSFEILAYPIETVLAEKITTAVNLGEINTRERDWADIWRLTGGHDLEGGTLTEALRRTAEYRGIPLRPLSQRIGSLVDSREGNYRTWRRRQGAEVDYYPEDFETLIGDVLNFADPLLNGRAPPRLPTTPSAARRHFGCPVEIAPTRLPRGPTPTGSAAQRLRLSQPENSERTATTSPRFSFMTLCSGPDKVRPTPLVGHDFSH